jgi:hypothetical protein
MKTTLATSGALLRLALKICLAASGSLGTTARGATIDVPVHGQLNLEFKSHINPDGKPFYELLTLLTSLDNQISITVPFVVPVSADPFAFPPVKNWTTPVTWNDDVLLFQPAIDFGTVIVDGALGNVGQAILGIPDAWHSIQQAGPTEQTLTTSVATLSWPGGSVDIQAGVTLKYDVTIPSGAAVNMNQDSMTVERLQVASGGTLYGDPRMIVRTSLINDGLISALRGTVEGDFINNSDASNGGGAMIDGTFNLKGQLKNIGTITVNSGALNLLSPTTTNSGKLIFFGGSLGGGSTVNNKGVFQLSGGSTDPSGTLLNTGNFLWTGGVIQGSGGLINVSQALISGSDTKIVASGSVLTNQGTVLHQGDGNTSVRIDYNGLLRNDATGVYDLQGDGGFVRPEINYSGGNISPRIENNGLLRKSAGTGTSTIDMELRNTGTVEVDSGTLAAAGGGSVDTSHFVFANGGRFQFAGGSFVLHGTNTIIGNGAVNISGAAVGVTTSGETASFSSSESNLEVSGGSLYANAGASLNLNLTANSRFKLNGGGVGADGVVTSQGNFDWTSGVIQGSGGLVNAGQGTISGATTTFKLIASNSLLTNQGTLTQQGDATVVYIDRPGILRNAASGLYDIQGDGGFALHPNPNSGFAPRIENYGTFRKSAGSGTSTISGSIQFYNNGGTVEVDSGTLTFAGGYTHTAGRILVNGGTFNSSTPIIIQAGSIEGNGTIAANVQDNGTISPGLSAGRLTFNGSLTLLNAAQAEFEIGGLQQGIGYDFIGVTGAATLGGTLQVTLANNFTPALGNSFDLLDWGSLSGHFSSVKLPTLSAGLAWNTTRLYTTGTVSVVDSNHVPGDFNRDHLVNAADISAMINALVNLNSYRTINSLTDADLLAIGDINGDGKLTNADVQSLLDSFKSGAGSMAPVPEPTSIVLMTLASMLVLRLGRIKVRGANRRAV